MGGFYFLLSILISLASSFVSSHLYSKHYEEGDNKLDANTLQTVLAVMCAIWITSLITFVSVMNKKYLRTFYNLDTASEYNRKIVLNYREDQDEYKQGALTDHPDIYEAWGDELLKPWTLENWNRWEAEKPAWFTDKWIDNVPNHYIPYDWRVKYKKTKGRVDDPQMRRRSSLAQVKTLLGGEEER
jgi:hypothetical protein